MTNVFGSQNGLKMGSLDSEIFPIMGGVVSVVGSGVYVGGMRVGVAGGCVEAVEVGGMDVGVWEAVSVGWVRNCVGVTEAVEVRLAFAVIS